MNGYEVSKLEAALKYQALDWSILALCPPDHAGCSKNHCEKCEQPGKAPIGKWKGLQERCATADELREAWRRNPTANVGLVLGPVSRMVRVDVDGEDGERLLQEISGGDLPDTLEFSSGGGGRGILFSIPDGVTVRTTTAKGDGDHQELRFQAKGAQSVIPPSQHSSGRFYEWKPGHGPDEIKVAPMPAWLVKALQPRKKQKQNATLPTDDRTTALEALGHLSANRADDRDQWLQVGMALHSVDAGLLSDWEAWSSQSSKFTEGECAEKWSGFNGSGGLTIASLVQWAKDDSGWTPPRRARGRASSGAQASSDKGYYRKTDYGNAERLRDRHRDFLLYCHPWKKWLFWDSKRWDIDNQGEIQQRAKETIRALYFEAAGLEDLDKRKALCEFAIKCESEKRLQAMIALTRDELPVQTDAFNSDGWLWNCPNGTLELKTGTLRPHRQADRLTKFCPTVFDPDASSYEWDRFLDGTFDGDGEMISFIQRWFGYCLTGDVREQILPIFWGTGSNGKSTLLNAIMHAMGTDYSMKASHDFLTVNRNNQHPTALADLFGMRFVVAIETGEDGRLNEVFVKETTGGDIIRARRMREDFWQFLPTHKTVLCTNHAPIIRGTDWGSGDASQWFRSS